MRIMRYFRHMQSVQKLFRDCRTPENNRFSWSMISEGERRQQHMTNTLWAFEELQRQAHHIVLWCRYLIKSGSLCNRSEELKIEAGNNFISHISVRRSNTTLSLPDSIYVFVVYIAVRCAKLHPSALSWFSCFATPQTWIQPSQI